MGREKGENSRIKNNPFSRGSYLSWRNQRLAGNEKIKKISVRRTITGKKNEAELRIVRIYRCHENMNDKKTSRE